MVHTRVRVPGKKKARRTFSNVKCRAQYYGRGESERERGREWSERAGDGALDDTIKLGL